MELWKKAEETAFELSYRLSKVPITSKVLLVILFAIQALVLPLLMIIRLSGGNIHSEYMHNVKRIILFTSSGKT